MVRFDVPVTDYMSSPVHTASPRDSLDSVRGRMAGLEISCLAVVEDGGLAGVITRSDLLRVGRRVNGRRGTDLIELPDATVADEMTHGAHSVTPEDTVAAAGRLMAKEYVHRVFVVDGGKLVGVISTHDLIRAVRDQGPQVPIEAHMSSPVFSVRADEPVAVATDRLGKAKVTGVVVLEDDWPVGVFTQVEALAARSMASTAVTEDAMDTAFLCMPTTTRLSRAAEQMARMRARRIVVVHKRSIVGILSGLDFAKYVADR